MIDINLISQKAKEWAREAGLLSIQRRKSPLELTFKSSPSDLVTAVDKEIEEFLVQKILKHFPDHGIVGEEGTFDKDPKQFDTLWIIDPIDGTTNFVHQQINYVVSIAIVHKGEGMVGVIYDPTRNEMFHGIKGKGAYLNQDQLCLDDPVRLREAVLCTSFFWNHRLEEYGLDKVAYELPRNCRGIRVFGCAALEMAYVAAGRIDAYLSLFLNPWDFAAGKIIVEEAGGRASTITGEELTFEQVNTVVVSNSSLYPELFSFLRR
ncbi:MAG TPA: inositol monophosphatase [Bacillota bacterium]|nr:inositol monophosphatase [Bacillota bacterium]